ncbi:MAG: gliding motility-associated C-terminal domain-containing protein [Lacibacter sp.]
MRKQIKKLNYQSGIKYLWILFIAMLFLTSNEASAQCTTLGQTPATAFPVCGTSVFSQANVPSCVNGEIKVPGCNASQNTYYDVNPFWYKFTCYSSGTLGLTINPIDANDDYDWQVWDITGLNPNDVFTNTNIVVVANWSGLKGETGTMSGSGSLIECGSYGSSNPPKYSKLPNIIAGHTYLLMISNFSNSQKGYQLSFGGGTAVITDPKDPALQQVKPNCGGDELRLKLNKKMKCSTIATNGSDFAAFSNGSIVATGARPIGCNSSFETDSVVITLSQPLPPGNYSLQLKTGSDGNTILDLCDRAILTTDAVNFTIYALQPTKLDSIAPLQCSPGSVRFVFSKPIKCSSIDPAGSDFSISGSYPVAITAAKGNCNSNGLTSDIIISFSQPLQNAGTFTVSLRPGFDGNTIIDECNQMTPPSMISFSVQDTVNADFNYSLYYGCITDTIIYNHPGGNAVNSWQWDFGSGGGATSQAEEVIYKTFGQKTTALIVSNGFCKDTVSKNIYLDNYLKAHFEIDTFNCPNEPVYMTGLDSSERPLTYFWSFGDGQTSTDEQPQSHIFPSTFTDAKYTITHTITNDLGCTNTYQKVITIVKTCRIDVPTAFTPNGDGLNDLFGPMNAVKADNFIFRIYNRWGQMIFESNNWLDQWDGKYKGIDQESTTYVWRLTYIDKDTKKAVERKGNFVLIR